MNKKKWLALAGAPLLALAGQNAMAACSDINRDLLQAATNAIVPATGTPNGGLGFPMWVTVVDETGKVCHVVTSGATGATVVGNDKWLGSRVISAQKANTANAFSTDSFALSSANLYGTVQPGGSLFGLQESNPVDASRAYLGSPNTYGKNGDPLKNRRIGGINVFGGGLALYTGGKKVGAIGVSGDTSCTDHVVAWKIRANLGMATVPGGVATGSTDALILASFAEAVTPGSSAAGVGGFNHPTCSNLPTNTVSDSINGTDAIQGN